MRTDSSLVCRWVSRIRQVLVLLTIAALVAGVAQAQPTLTPELRQKVDETVRAVLAATGVPSASIAIVKDGQIAYVQAYGAARLEPKTPAQPSMRYSIGSISKQFTAAAILKLQEQGKLSLDDKVARFLPKLTRADAVSVRQLLAHTSGYQDYWPQDYVMPMMLEQVTAEKIMDLWARKPLDFDPGTRWQYSNTNYVIAGAIAEKAGGMPLFRFLERNIFAPLGMKSVTDIDEAKLAQPDPAGYMRYALGPLRPAPKEGRGWLFAAGELAMTAEDLAKWDISLIDGKLLQAGSYRELETDFVLANGLGTGYGLGVAVRSESQHREISHGGEVSGFTAQNAVYPDDRAAIVVLTNQDAASASGEVARRIAPLLFTIAEPASAQKLEQARSIFRGLQHGEINRALFTDNANSYFSKQALDDFAVGLAPLGEPAEFTETRSSLRGGMRLRVYQVKFPQKNLRVWTYEMPDGRLEQYQVAATD